jgi:Ion transport protein
MVLPVKLSFFSDTTNITWNAIDLFVDCVFYVDMVLTFFTPYWESEKLILSLRSIAWNYFKFWFWIDLVSVFPFEQIIDGGDAVVLVRISRLPKLYRLVKITRMFRTIKATRNQNNILSQIQDFLKMSPSKLIITRL